MNLSVANRVAIVAVAMGMDLFGSWCGVLDLLGSAVRLDIEVDEQVEEDGTEEEDPDTELPGVLTVTEEEYLNAMHKHHCELHLQQSINKLS